MYVEHSTEISVLQWPLSIPLATQTHLPLEDTRILTWWWPPEAETCRLIIKIPYIRCNKLFSNSCLVFNLNYYKFVLFDVHTLLFSILISTTGTIHLNNEVRGLKSHYERGCGFDSFVLCGHKMRTFIETFFEQGVLKYLLDYSVYSEM